MTRTGALIADFVVGACLSSALACSVADGDVGGPSAPSAAGGVSGGSGIDLGKDGGFAPDYAPDAFFANDPPPADCTDSGAKPVEPGGTPECPADKNLQGCPCSQPGATAACWPGYRKNRNRGACHDGKTTCVQKGEFDLAWGACEGFTGIDPLTFEPLGTSGESACKCFSAGYWQVDNLVPCFECADASCTTITGASSTWLNGGYAECATAGEPFSANSLSVDCSGYFQLCFTIKALAAPGASRSSTDCVMARVCTEGHYDGGAAQKLPDLPAWSTNTPAEKACAGAFVANGGYGEFSVTGTSDECDQVDKTFVSFDYCPWKCEDPAHYQDPECVGCANGMGGQF